MSNGEARMTFTEHLGELRTRIIRAAIALVIGVVVAFPFREILFQIIARPLMKPELGIKWAAMTPFESFVVLLKLSMYGGIFLALPVILYQACAFVFPGLNTTERKLVQSLLVGCGILAAAGLAVAYFGVFPLVLPYLLQWTPEGVDTIMRMSETIAQILLGLLGFVITFQFPMLILVLVYMGLLSPATLRSYRRVAIVIIAVASAVFTPPEPLSMMIMMIPMVILYEGSIWASYLVMRKKKA